MTTARAKEAPDAPRTPHRALRITKSRGGKEGIDTIAAAGQHRAQFFQDFTYLGHDSHMLWDQADFTVGGKDSIVANPRNGKPPTLSRR
jgi:hypothetical protein